MLELIPIIFFLYFFAILAWRNLVWGLALIAGLLPLYLWRWQLGFIPVTILEGMILVLFLIWLFKKTTFPSDKGGLRGGGEERNTIANTTPLAPLIRGVNAGWLWPIAAWLVVATVAVFISPNIRAALGLWKAYFIEPILFFIIFISVIKSKKDLRLCFYALGISTLYIGALAVYQKFTGYLISTPSWLNPSTRRVTAVYGYPNAIGLYLAPLAVLFFALFIKNIKKIKVAIFFLISCLFSITSIILAVSEGAMIAAAAGIFIWLLFYKKTRRAAVILALILFIALQFMAPWRQTLMEKITLRDFSGQLRREMWGETWQMLKERPLGGAGLAGYQQTVAPFHKKDYIEIYLYPHNIFLNFWSELGFLGLLVFLWVTVKFYYQGFKILIKNKKNYLLTAGLLSVMSALLIHGLVDVPYFKNDLSVFFWLLIGSLLVLEKIDKLQ